MGLLSRLMGWPNSPPPKALPPLQTYQFPIGPGGVTGDPPPAPPPMPDEMANKLRGQSLGEVLDRGPFDMSAQGGPALPPLRGLEPPSAPMDPAPLDLNAEMNAAMARARGQSPWDDPMMAWYRRTGEQDLNSLRDRGAHYSRLAQATEARRRRLLR